jgi:acyl carrier protein
MERNQILSVMKAYFADLHGPEKVEDFETLRAGDLIEDSVDAVTFIMHLEDQTGRNIPISEVGTAFNSLTFKDLAAQLAPRLTGELQVLSA